MGKFWLVNWCSAVSCHSKYEQRKLAKYSLVLVFSSVFHSKIYFACVWMIKLPDASPILKAFPVNSNFSLKYQISYGLQLVQSKSVVSWSCWISKNTGCVLSNAISLRLTFVFWMMTCCAPKILYSLCVLLLTGLLYTWWYFN